MRHYGRVVIVALVLAHGVGCKGASSVCPEGTHLVKERSTPGKEVWCRSKDGATARWLIFNGRDLLQSCGFRDGKAEGTFTAWHPGGKPWLQGDYREGAKVGRWTQWDAAGNKVAEGEYRTGQYVSGAPVGTPAQCERLKP